MRKKRVKEKIIISIKEEKERKIRGKTNSRETVQFVIFLFLCFVDLGYLILGQYKGPHLTDRFISITIFFLV